MTTVLDAQALRCELLAYRSDAKFRRVIEECVQRELRYGGHVHIPSRELDRACDDVAKNIAVDIVQRLDQIDMVAVDLL
jgi:hypothetical protein